jgi:hypothetical protein
VNDGIAFGGGLGVIGISRGVLNSSTSGCIVDTLLDGITDGGGMEGGVGVGVVTSLDTLGVVEFLLSGAGVDAWREPEGVPDGRCLGVTGLNTAPPFSKPIVKMSM